MTNLPLYVFHLGAALSFLFGIGPTGFFTRNIFLHLLILFSCRFPAPLIQHVSQLSFLLTAVQKEPNRPKRKIGFSIQED